MGNAAQFCHCFRGTTLCHLPNTVGPERVELNRFFVTELSHLHSKLQKLGTLFDSQSIKACDTVGL